MSATRPQRSLQHIPEHTRRTTHVGFFLPFHGTTAVRHRKAQQRERGRAESHQVHVRMYDVHKTLQNLNVTLERCKPSNRGNAGAIHKTAGPGSRVPIKWRWYSMVNFRTNQHKILLLWTTGAHIHTTRYA